MMKKEGDMIPLIERYFNELGNYSIYEEIPVARRKIDLVMLNNESSEIITIELKIKDWKKVFFQSLYNQFCSNYSYAAIWEETIEKIDESLFKKYGIGVLEVNEHEANLIFKAKRMNSMLTPSMIELKRIITTMS